VLQLKDLRGRTVSKKVTVWDGKISRELDRGSLERLNVVTFEGWERQNEMEARCGWETAAGGWDSAYTGEDSMGAARS
jgi:hypothetical protein